MRRGKHLPLMLIEWRSLRSSPRQGKPATWRRETVDQETKADVTEC